MKLLYVYQLCYDWLDANWLTDDDQSNTEKYSHTNSAIIYNTNIQVGYCILPNSFAKKELEFYIF